MGSAIKHGSFTIERRYAAPPPKVFAAFAQADARRKWLVFAEGWTIHEYRPAEPTVAGAVEFSRFSPPGAEVILTNATTWLHVDEGGTLIYAYHMTIGGAPLSSSLVTIGLHPDGDGTRLELTEQGAYFDGNISGREEGTRALLDEVEKVL
ncbi:SRPBCC domain-containing protein [Leptolyngbya sp. 15MV]|nr:SRPBCC domain-containing protein [Leptolyngbya sp. 15MV]